MTSCFNDAKCDQVTGDALTKMSAVLRNAIGSTSVCAMAGNASVTLTIEEKEEQIVLQDLLATVWLYHGKVVLSECFAFLEA